MKIRLGLFIAVITLYQGALGLPSIHAEALDCLLEPYDVVDVSSPVEGVLATVTVDRGDRVKKGQVIATLESSFEKATVALARARTQMDAAVKAAKARLDLSIKRVTRNEDLFKQELISLDEIQEARTVKRVAEMDLLDAIETGRLNKLELERAIVTLERRTVQSPLTGVIVKRFLSPGEFTSKELPILKAAQLNPLRVEVIVPVSWLGKVSVGAQAEVLPEAPMNSVHVARVTVVDPVVDAASGTVGIRLELPNPKYHIPAGLKCKVRFLTGGKGPS